MIYIDFDGVIFNTLKRLEDIAGCVIDKYDLSNYGLDLSVFGREDFYLKSDDYLIPTVITYLRKMKKIGKITILTKYCSESEKNNKKDFIKNYLKIIGLKVIFVESTESKQSFMNREDYLIDDQMDNLKQNSLFNILFDITGEYSKEWNECKDINVVKCTTWNEVFKHIVFVEEIKHK